MIILAAVAGFVAGFVLATWRARGQVEFLTEALAIYAGAWDEKVTEAEEILRRYAPPQPYVK